MLKESVEVDSGSTRTVWLPESVIGSLEQPIEVFSLYPIPAARHASRYLLTKRMLDVVLAFLGLIALMPLMVLIAIAIKVSDGGPILFQQIRVGERGRRFRFFKFRSMVVDADTNKAILAKQNRHADSRTFKMANDPRITRIGRVIRKLSIDELPQLWNVLKGDMSIVGPRPPIPEEVALYTAKDWLRFSVKPGLTCLWQVSGRSNLPFPQQVHLDLEYIRRQSFWFDVILIIRTIPAVLFCRGAE